MSKTKKFIISLVASITIFMAIVAIEKTVVKYTPMVKAVYCTKDVSRREQLTQASFGTKDIPITSVNSDTVLSMNSIINMYAKDNIYSGELLNKNRIGTKDSIESLNLNPGERAISLSFQNLEDCVGGTLRKDDIVDVIFTNTTTANNLNVITQTKFNNLRIINAIDASGRVLDKADTAMPATTFIFAASPTIDMTLANLKQSQGKITLMKVPNDDKKGFNITIQNGIPRGGK